MMGGKAPMAMAVMWSLVALTWIFVFLRLYTRAFIIKSVGLDDHTYWLSGIAAYHGFGQSMPGPDASNIAFDHAAYAIKNQMIGQTFAVIGMSIAKFSLGFFLLRIVVEKWQRIAIWFAMVTLSFFSGLCAIMFWLQCTPVTKIFDPIRVEGVCNISVTPYAVALGGKWPWFSAPVTNTDITVCCVIVDFFFATFPWIFIWKLNMKYNEKITIAGSMSLGFLAGICGIVRTYEVATGFTTNFLLDTVPLIIWSAAEMTLTLMCIGIPILCPLWRRVVRGSKISSEGYYRRHGEGYGEGFNLGSVLLGSDKANNRGFPNAPAKLGIRGPGTITRIAGDNYSDESILGSEYRRGRSSPVGGICVKQDIQIDWSDAKDIRQ
ncbi:hypothetical protein FPSE_02259 [Fusarium pseudograminearum CS3096]|uniref:Rhodopsin domain-containing protein n=1 Tax=Fusarium pseudograminearum (strain CS3096) TaxID=1028729 RepID=K3UYA5_FUSPC|nr:hypothetical protein FPSE_02259 [Fusarium pseudograminearum CS3096]EKJ77761.1 hypothetical protein FPSE_02259 [Fusarium pseudograminearum CS3096]